MLRTVEAADGAEERRGTGERSAASFAMVLSLSVSSVPFSLLFLFFLSLYIIRYVSLKQDRELNNILSKF